MAEEYSALSDFERLAAAIRDPEELKATYGAILESLFQAEPWCEENPKGGRIPWYQGYRAREILVDEFASAGLYLWGVRKTPLYVGMTAKTFRKRFYRYIWDQRSQCNLAQRYEAELKAHGMDGFPPEIRAWYRKNFGQSTARLKGAVAFVEHGLQDVWFAILPADESAPIKELEKRLIRVANEWNIEHGLSPLINVEYGG